MDCKKVWTTILAIAGIGTAACAQDSLRIKSSLSDTLALQQSVVTARSRAQKLKEGAYSVEALNIRSQAASLQSLTRAIDRSAGIRIREEGGVGSEFDLSINGMGGNSVRYFLDGMPLDAKGTGVTLSNLPVNIIDRVEIYKGVIPAGFGSDALGGAVNIITNRSRRNFLDFSYGTGSFHTHKTEINAQYTGKKTGLVVKPVISAAYSKNDYLMRDVKVRNADRTAFIIADLPRFHDRYLSLFGQLEAGVAGRHWADDFFLSASVSKLDKELQTGATQSYVIGMAERNSRSLNLSVRYSKRGFVAENLDFSAVLSHTWDHSQTIDTTYRRYYWDGSYMEGTYSEIRHRGRTLRNYYRPMTVIRGNFEYHISDNHSLALNYLLNRTGNRQDDECDKDGNQVFGFGVYGGIAGVLNDDGEYDDDSYDRFMDGLKECVAEDDAILIFEAGHEKLRYVGGGVTIITSKSIEYLNLQDAGCRKARELLGNNDWTTKCDY